MSGLEQTQEHLCAVDEESSEQNDINDLRDATDKIMKLSGCEDRELIEREILSLIASVKVHAAIVLQDKQSNEESRQYPTSEQVTFASIRNFPALNNCGEWSLEDFQEELDKINHE